MTSEYAGVLAQLFARTNGGIKLGLETTRRLLRALGSPDAAMRHVLVAGTNGKGTTSALLEHALRRAGHRVGLFTSPHLNRFTERIRIDGKELEPEQAVALFREVERAEGLCDRPPTFFECATAMAMLAFRRAGVQIAVLEVGLGGRLDATNVVEREIAVITSVALDHQRYLGNTLAKIAAEKAGIIPTDGVVVSAPQQDEARQVIAQVATKRRARLLWAPTWSVDQEGLILAGDHPAFPLRFPAWPPGLYQQENLATATMAVLALRERGLTCAREHLLAAARELSWPGRYQWLEQEPPVLLDGAHNPAGLAALVDTLGRDPRIVGRKVHAICTALRDRCLAEMLEPLRPKTTSVHLCPVSSARSLSPLELKEQAPWTHVHAGFSHAWEAARAAARRDAGVVLVTGSLRLVAAALASSQGIATDPQFDG